MLYSLLSETHHRYKSSELKKTATWLRVAPSTQNALSKTVSMANSYSFMSKFKFKERWTPWSKITCYYSIFCHVCFFLIYFQLESKVLEVRNHVPNLLS